MKKTDKEQLVVELKEKIGGAQALYYTDFTGLNVKRMTELRRRFRKANIEYVVIKNTLALRAVNESGLVGERLKGPTGLVIGRDAVGAAKVLTDFAPAFDVANHVVRLSADPRSPLRAVGRRYPVLRSERDVLVLLAPGRVRPLDEALRELTPRWWQLDLPHGVLVAR